MNCIHKCTLPLTYLAVSKSTYGCSNVQNYIIFMQHKCLCLLCVCMCIFCLSVSAMCVCVSVRDVFMLVCVWVCVCTVCVTPAEIELSSPSPLGLGNNLTLIQKPPLEGGSEGRKIYHSSEELWGGKRRIKIVGRGTHHLLVRGGAYIIAVHLFWATSTCNYGLS